MVTEAIAAECETNPEKQFEYLSSNLQMILMYNTERFNPHEYDGDKMIVRHSQIIQQNYNPRLPSWQPYSGQLQELEDESSLLQYG